MRPAAKWLLIGGLRSCLFSRPATSVVDLGEHVIFPVGAVNPLAE